MIVLHFTYFFKNIFLLDFFFYRRWKDKRFHSMQTLHPLGSINIRFYIRHSIMHMFIITGFVPSVLVWRVIIPVWKCISWKVTLQLIIDTIKQGWTLRSKCLLVTAIAPLMHSYHMGMTSEITWYFRIITINYKWLDEYTDFVSFTWYDYIISKKKKKKKKTFLHFCFFNHLTV